MKRNLPCRGGQLLQSLGPGGSPGRAGFQFGAVCDQNDFRFWTGCDQNRRSLISSCARRTGSCRGGALPCQHRGVLFFGVCEERSGGSVSCVALFPFSCPRSSLDSLAGSIWKVGRGGVTWSAPAPFQLSRPSPSRRACSVVATPAAFASRCVRGGGAGLNRGRIFVQVRGGALHMQAVRRPTETVKPKLVWVGWWRGFLSVLNPRSVVPCDLFSNC
eukprot:2976802-Rhodomonas_salina.1